MPHFYLKMLKTPSGLHSSNHKFHIIALIICFSVFVGNLFYGSLFANVDWTVMIYMCGDNSMNDQTYTDLEEMMQVGSSEQIKVVVQVDHLPSSIEPGCQRYLIENGNKTELADLGNVDMADPQTLIDFVQSTYSQFNANKYLLILWDHGNGWPIGYYNANKDKAIIYDQSSNNWIGVADGELHYAVTEIKKILGKKISILGFDACLMGMTEVASEISDAVDFMVASEEVTPWNGFPYNDILSALTANPTISAQSFSMRLVEIATNSYNHGSQGYEPATYSAIDLKKFSAEQNEFSKSCGILTQYANTAQMRQARNQTQTFSIESNPPTPNDDYIDLIDFLERAQNEITNQNDRDKFKKTVTAFQNSVLAQSYVGSYLQNAKGLAVWFPDNYIAFKNQISDYENLSWQKKTSWLSFLNNYYSSDDIKPTSVEICNPNVINSNDFRLIWHKSIDLVPVRYNLLETKGIQVLLENPCDSFINWTANGFVLSSQQFHSSSSSFFSGTGNNLNNTLIMNNPISLPSGGLLSFWSYYATEESYVLPGIIKRDIFYVELSQNGISYRGLDSIYGKKKFWSENRYILPSSESLWIRFRYTTDASVSALGVYIDDIKFSVFSNTRLINLNIAETTFDFFNIPKADYFYLITPIDSFGNVGFTSPAQEISIENYCQPFSLPSPFMTDCKIYCDFSSSNRPKAYIYTISGELIKQFSCNAFSHDTLYWNGRNDHNQEIATGLYIILLKDGDVIRTGKIAKVK
jgi:hypothetical protein